MGKVSFNLVQNKTFAQYSEQEKVALIITRAATSIIAVFTKPKKEKKRKLANILEEFKKVY